MGKDSMSIARDIEKMHIKKKDLQKILAALKRRWRKNARANAAYITAATAIQGALILTPEYVVQRFWGDLIKAINYLLELNAMRDPDSEIDMAYFYEKLESKIESGELFGGD